jgi:branched-chain amino acid aminotransferase
MEYVFWLNGEFVPASQARVSIMDAGFMMGDVVFDTTRTFNGKVFRLRDHMERFYRSLHYAGIDPGMTMVEMEELTLEVARRNEPSREPGGDFCISQIVSSSDGVSDPPKPTVCVWVYSLLVDTYSPFLYKGIHLVIPKTRSPSSEQLDPKIKHKSRIVTALAEREAQDVDPDSRALLLDTQGNLSEGTGFNVFIVTDGVLRTPTERSILQGISRKVTLELAEQLQIPVHQEDLQPYDLYNADEAFMTNSSVCVLPVSKADNRRVGREVPGLVTLQLQTAWSEMVGLDIVDQFAQLAKARSSRSGSG